jgi:O-antigen/teichoic acid export membrane protein
MAEIESYARRFFKGSAVVLIALVASGFVGFLLRVLLARTLSVAEYGLFYAVFSLVSIFGMFRDIGVGQALVKYIPEFTVSEQFDEVKSSMAILITVQILLTFPIGMTLFFMSDRIALTVFGTQGASQVIKILGIWFFAMTFFYTFQPTFQGFQNMPMYACMEFCSIFFVLIFAIVFLDILHLGLGGVALAYLASSFALAILGLAIFLRIYPHVLKGKARITKQLILKLLKFSLPIFLSGLGIFVLTYTDTIMIAIFRSMEEVGFYQAAQPAARALWYLPMAVTVVLFPMISELWVRREEQLLSQTLFFVIKFSFVLIVLPALVLMTFPEIFLRLFFGPAYLPGSLALQILAGAMVVNALYAILSYTMAGIGKPVVTTKVVAIMASLNVIMNLLLIPAYGVGGAAAATFASQFIGLLLMLHYAMKHVEFSMPTLSILKTIWGGLLTMLIIFGLKSIVELPPWFELLIVMAPSLLFYIAWIILTKTLTPKDLELLEKVGLPLKSIAKRFRRIH